MTSTVYISDKPKSKRHNNTGNKNEAINLRNDSIMTKWRWACFRLSSKLGSPNLAQLQHQKSVLENPCNSKLETKHNTKKP